MARSGKCGFHICLDEWRKELEFWKLLKTPISRRGFLFGSFLDRQCLLRIAWSIPTHCPRRIYFKFIEPAKYFMAAFRPLSVPLAPSPVSLMAAAVKASRISQGLAGVLPVRLETLFVTHPSGRNNCAGPMAPPQPNCLPFYRAGARDGVMSGLTPVL